MIEARRVVTDNIYIYAETKSGVKLDQLALTIEEAEDLLYVLGRELNENEHRAV